MGFNMGPEQDGTEGMDPTAKKISDTVEGFASQLFGKPRREHDQNRKVGRDDLYGRFTQEQDFGKDGTRY